MRRGVAVAAVLAGLLCAGCSAGGEQGAAPTSAPTTGAGGAGGDPGAVGDPGGDPGAGDDAVTLSGEPGAAPDFRFAPPLVVGDDVARVAQAGTGDPVGRGDAVMVLMASVDGADGTAQGDGGTVPELLLADGSALPPALLDVLVGERVGGRLLYATPDDAGGAIVYSLEIVSTRAVLGQAEGTAAAPDPGLPAVTAADDGRPSLAPAGGAPPAGLVAQPLVVGDGEPLGQDSWMVVHYASWLWDGTEVTSTWEYGSPYAMPLSEAHAGWQQGLVGRTVGSRVLLVVPPELALGDEEVDGVPAGSTLVFVVDVLTAA